MACNALFIWLCVRHSSKDIVSATIRLDAKLTLVTNCCLIFLFRVHNSHTDHGAAELSKSGKRGPGLHILSTIKRVESEMVTHTQKCTEIEHENAIVFLLIERKWNSFANTSTVNNLLSIKFCLCGFWILHNYYLLYLERGKLLSSVEKCLEDIRFSEKNSQSHQLELSIRDEHS